MPNLSIFTIRCANKVLIGDEVLVQGNDELTSTKVIDVSRFLMQGNYFYLTILK